METENHKKITLKLEDFKYPTKEEIKFADSQCPKFSNLGFKYKSGIVLAMQGITVEEASRAENLHCWDNVLLNRFGSLRGAYFDILTHYNRGFKEDYRECSEIEMVNRLLFDNNAEIFYYFFFVTVDVIAQILNLYFRLNLSEDKVAFNEKLIHKISELSTKKAIQKFLYDTKRARDYRNGFTHRFPSNYPDNRLRIEEKNDRIEMFLGSSSFVSSKKILKNINDSLNSLSILMKELKNCLTI